MLLQKTILNQIEITQNGTIQVRFALVVENNGVTVASKFHRTAIIPGGDIQAQIDSVNQHLAQMGEMPVDAASVDRIMAFSTVAWTPEVVAAYRQSLKSSGVVK